MQRCTGLAEVQRKETCTDVLYAGLVGTKDLHRCRMQQGRKTCTDVEWRTYEYSYNVQDLQGCSLLYLHRCRGKDMHRCKCGDSHECVLPTYLCRTVQQYAGARLYVMSRTSKAGVFLDEPDSAKPAQRSSYTGPPGYIGWTRFQPMYPSGPVRLLR